MFKKDMTKIKSRLAVALLAFVIGIAITTVSLFREHATPIVVSSPSQEVHHLRLIIPHARWEPFFFRSLDEHLSNIGLPSLRTVKLSDNDIEVRIWYDVLPQSINGIVLRRSSDRWSAVHIHGMYQHPHFQVEQEPLAAPMSGWQMAWGRLISLGLLTLPDESELQCRPDVLDGVGIVVEINMNRTYTTYRYSNPQLAECTEAKRMLKISEMVMDEFGLEIPHN